MKFLGNYMERENIMLSEVTQLQKNTHDMYTMIRTWILHQKVGIPKVQLPEYMKLKKNEDHNVNASVLLEEGIKYSWEVNSGREFGGREEAGKVGRIRYDRRQG